MEEDTKKDVADSGRCGPNGNIDRSVFSITVSLTKTNLDK